MTAGVIGRMAPELERFLHRHILGAAPHPDHWPAPADIDRLPVPPGRDISDETGASWVLASEHMRAWHHRRTSIGAHGYRFAHNGEFDCGWRLADVAARFVLERLDTTIDMITLLPPPPIYRSRFVLPWVTQRLAERLRVPFVPNLFDAAAPYAEHPDIARHLAIPTTSLFSLSRETDIQLSGVSVLLVDWMRYTGQTLRALAQLLKRKGATVIRLTWFD
ncbi:MAG: hypothetical protein Kow0074_25690 [Candidatus Zixiibacteriota bacterium]